MTAIYFNSWLEEYKHPFGAIQQLNTAHFSINVKSAGVEKVSLIMRKEDGERGFERLPMTAETDDFYKCSYTFDQGKGLYFYYFEVLCNGEATIYCGSNQGNGGIGVLSTAIEEVHPYQITCYETHDPAPDWYRNGVVYQIFPDRFFNGNLHREISHSKRNTFIYGTYEDEPLYLKDENDEIIRWDFFGGNLMGIIKKVPYLKSLGVTVLYLNPIFEAASNHRYDTGDYFAVDGILGDEETFEQLVSILHENDMRLILDGVFSHVGRNSRYFNHDGRYGKGSGAYQNIESPYYPWFSFSEYPEEYKSWWGIKDLPEINKDNTDFQQFIYGKDGVLDKWTSLGVDGWRLDVADELPDFFITGIRQRLNQYPEKVLIGEVWEDASKKISYDQRREYVFGNALHGVMNYPFRESILAYLDEKQTPQQLAEQLTILQENYPEAIFYNNLNNIGTHDTERILTLLDNNTTKLSFALGLMFMLPGVPTIYYGDEAGLTGGKDPANRKFFPWENQDQAIFENYQRWVRRRTENPILAQGGFYPFYTDELLGVLRCHKGQSALYLVNLTDKEVAVSIDNLHFTKALPIFESLLQELLKDVVIAEHSDCFIMKK